MNCRVAFGSLAITALFVTTAAPTALAQPTAPAPVHDTALNYTLQMPAGWVEMPAAQLKGYNDGVKAMQTPVPIVYVRGYNMMDAKGEPVAYMLMQQKAGSVGRAEIDSIERGIYGSEMSDAKRQAQEMGKQQGVDVSFSRPSFDRATGRILVPAGMVVEGVRLQTLSYGFIGAEGIATIVCFTGEAEFPALKPDFDRVAAGLRFDPGSTYADAQARAGGGKGLFDNVVTFGAVGGVIGAIVAIFASNKKKKLATATPIPTPPAKT